MRLLGRSGRRARPERPSPRPATDTTATPGLRCAEIPPEHCDPEITPWREPHLVAHDSSVPALGQLFLFLCGSHGIPARQHLITTLAARLGYHAINLSYPNSWTVGGLCRDSTDPDCHGRVRLDILDGAERSGLVQVGPTDSIEHRLRTLLAHLADRAPDQGWARFLDTNGQIDWATLVVAGHSQGGGHAAIIGKCHTVARVIMLAAPVDYVQALRSPAAWLAAPGATPAERYFGFVHRADQGLDKILQAWTLLGLDTRPLTRIDDNEPPYGHAQRLVTDQAPVPRDRYHNCVVQDRTTPLRLDGTPIFEPVWRYLLADSSVAPLTRAA